eukprot:1134990-Amphidinium_carterae.1
MVLTVLAERPGLDSHTVRFWQSWLYDREDEQLLLQAWELSKYTASRGQHATIMAFMSSMSALGWKPHGLTEWQDDQNAHWNLQAMVPSAFTQEVPASWQRLTCQQIRINRSDYDALTPLPRKLVMHALRGLDTLTQNQIVHHMQGGGWTWAQEMQRRRKQTQCP